MRNPFLFILGCQRSGTTLLQHMVDIHPLTTVMQESGWFGTWYELKIGLTPDGFVTPELIPKLLKTSKNIDLGLNAEELLEMAGSGSRPVHYRDFISELFDRYGLARGKRLVGSKNPDFLRRAKTLHQLWPEAKFVHIVRDGRDVCLSASERWRNKPNFVGFPFLLYEAPDRIFDQWSEDPVITTAIWWEWNVSLGRRFGTELPDCMYYEMRYEALVENPRGECEGLCEFLGIPFDEAMLRHQDGFKPRRTREGKVLHASVGLPVTVGLRDWRTEMDPSELARFEAAVGDFLTELGYERAVAIPSADGVASATRIRDLFNEIAGVRDEL